MKNKKMFVISIVLGTLALFGTVKAYTVMVLRDIQWFDSFKVGEEDVSFNKYGIVDTFIDNNNNVVCYVVKGRISGTVSGSNFSISCVKK